MRKGNEQNMKPTAREPSYLYDISPLTMNTLFSFFSNRLRSNKREINWIQKMKGATMYLCSFEQIKVYRSS